MQKYKLKEIATLVKIIEIQSFIKKFLRIFFCKKNED